jgi:hypothetical protein
LRISEAHDTSKGLKKNAGKTHPGRVDLRSMSPVSDSSLTGSAELYFGVDDS